MKKYSLIILIALSIYSLIGCKKEALNNKEEEFVRLKVDTVYSNYNGVNYTNEATVTIISPYRVNAVKFGFLLEYTSPVQEFTTGDGYISGNFTFQLPETDFLLTKSMITFFVDLENGIRLTNKGNIINPGTNTHDNAPYFPLGGNNFYNNSGSFYFIDSIRISDTVRYQIIGVGTEYNLDIAFMDSNPNTNFPVLGYAYPVYSTGIINYHIPDFGTINDGSETIFGQQYKARIFMDVLDKNYNPPNDIFRVYGSIINFTATQGPL